MGAGWRPNPGDSVSGEVVDADRAESGYGPYVVLAVATPEGPVIDVHAFHDSLIRQLTKRAIQIGSQVSITYEGRAGDGPKDAHIYRVTGGKTPAIDWADASVGVTDTPALESAEDVPIDTAGLPAQTGVASGAPKSITEHVQERFGDDVPY